ncbi:hypothetical protein [Paracoccus sp. PAMC 22219]|uniref:hypothetical protein n=1 Tax=Paracoccus sp. PAMC 22219 TaxID=1569209 RepID=UPI0012E09208|nr:hypothetical protein [Paracoccus sp. PAMC 22219]
MSVRTRILLIVFAGTHVPLLAAVTAVSLLHVTAVQALLTILLLSTLAGAVMSMLAIARVMRSQPAIVA